MVSADAMSWGARTSGGANGPPRLLLVGGKDSGFRSASDTGVPITLLQSRENVSPMQIQRAAELFVSESFSDPATISLARLLHAQHEFAAVLSFDERRLELASRVGQALGVRHNPLNAVRRTRDKIEMRKRLTGAGFPVTRFAECSVPGDVVRFLETVDAPMVLKPRSGSGSRGIHRIESTADVPEAWARCTAVESPPTLAEEYVDGPEFSVETLTLGGVHTVLATTEKLTTGAPAFIETGHQLPARLSDQQAAEIRRMVVDLLDAVGHQWGPGHTEFKLTSRGPVVIETHTRFGGDQIWEMVELVTGVRFGAAAVSGMLGLDCPGSVPPVAGGAAIRYFAYENGTVVDVQGVEAARGMPGVVRVEMRSATGDVLGSLRGSGCRQGYVLAVGGSVEEAVQRAERAHTRVRFRFAPHPRTGMLPSRRRG
jgi:biotin carboxylase